jgi:ribonuclease-3
MDGGFDAASAVIARLYKPVLETVDPKTLGKDAKTLLQEYLQGRKIALPVYTVVATHGAAHSQEFEVECAIPKLDVQVVGIGGSRRAAEQAAAKQALEAALAANPTPAKRSPRARKTAQLSLPVAVAQEVPDEPANAAKVEAAAVSAPARAAVIEAPVAKITSTQAAEGKAPVPAAAPRKEPQAAPPAPQPPGETLSASGQPAGKK